MLEQETSHCIRNLRIDADGILSADFLFPVDYTGFKGHFPGKPVLPGVCLVQAALAAHRQGRNRSARLREIVSAKFWAAVQPDTPVHLVCRESAESDGTVLIKARVDASDKKVAEIWLKASGAQPAASRSEPAAG